jgi:hypothetical protein
MQDSRHYNNRALFWARLTDKPKIEAATINVSSQLRAQSSFETKQKEKPKRAGMSELFDSYLPQYMRDLRGRGLKQGSTLAL